MILVFGVMISALYAATGTVSITSDTMDADIYIDGKKRAVSGEGPVTLSLQEGRHEIMVIKPLDEDWHQVKRANVEIKNAETIALSFSLDLEKISKRENKSTIEHFVKKGDIVIDNNLDLVWQDDERVMRVQKNWDDAKQYCRSLSLSGAKNWRLPTYDELITIVDFNKNTLAVMSAFEHVLSEYYWTSDADHENPENAKGIYFGNGCPNTISKADLSYIRCVRVK
jgi:hypothetical protein